MFNFDVAEIGSGQALGQFLEVRQPGLVVARHYASEHGRKIAADNVHAMVCFESPMDDRGTCAGFQAKPGPRFAGFPRVDDNVDEFDRSTLHDGLSTSADDSPVPCYRRPLTACRSRIDETRVRVGLGPGGPQRKTSEIIDEREYRCLVRIDFPGYLDTVRAWQGKPDQDHCHE